jgi:hypothetical protein
MFGHRDESGDTHPFVGENTANYLFSRSKYNPSDTIKKGEWYNEEEINFLDIAINKYYTPLVDIQYLIRKGAKVYPRHIEKAKEYKKWIIETMREYQSQPKSDHVVECDYDKKDLK